MNNVSFYGGETSGNIAYGSTNIRKYETAHVQSPEESDKVCFKGINDHKEKTSSVIGGFIGILGAAALVVAGLGYAHKTNAVSKLKDGKVKNFLKKSDKVTKPCHEICSKVKTFCTKYYNKIKNYFTKKN